MGRTAPLLLRYADEHPEDPHGPFFLAQVYAGADWPACEVWARRCVELAPDEEACHEAWIWLAQAVGVQRGVHEAIRIIDEAIPHHPASPDLWHLAANLAALKWRSLVGSEPYDRLAVKRVDADRARSAFLLLGFDLAPAEQAP